MQSTHPLSTGLVFEHVGVGKRCFASIGNVDASALQQEEQACSSKCISSSRAIEEMSREFSKAKHSHSATPQSSTCATDSQFKGVNRSNAYARAMGEHTLSAVLEYTLTSVSIAVPPS